MLTANTHAQLMRTCQAGVPVSSPGQALESWMWALSSGPKGPRALHSQNQGLNISTAQTRPTATPATSGLGTCVHSGPPRSRPASPQPTKPALLTISISEPSPSPSAFAPSAASSSECKFRGSRQTQFPLLGPSPSQILSIVSCRVDEGIAGCGS